MGWSVLGGVLIGITSHQMMVEALIADVPPTKRPLSSEHSRDHSSAASLRRDAAQHCLDPFEQRGGPTITTAPATSC